MATKKKKEPREEKYESRIKIIKDTPIAPYKSQLAEMKEEFTTWRPYFYEIAQYFAPRRGKYLNSPDSDVNARKHYTTREKILNGTTEDAARMVAAGMHGGMTSPSYPWFELALEDEELMKWGPVRMWLYTVRNIMLSIYARSNFYESMYSQYFELPVFGTAAMMMEEDFETVIRFRPYTIGEYYLAYDENYRITTMFRNFQMTARMMLQKFGEEPLSNRVIEAINNSKPETRFEVISGVQLNKHIDPAVEGRRAMEYESVYYEYSNNEDKFLFQGGYSSKPFAAPRWDVVGIDIYGDGLGSMSLGDAKMLQKEEEKKLKALDKMVDPPMNATSDLKKKGAGQFAGALNFMDVAQGATGFSPAYQINPDLEKIAYEIATVEQRIRRFFFNDLFLAILNSDKNMTATEVATKNEEKIQMLGPVINSLQQEQLDPVITRTFIVAEERGLFPEAPFEMDGLPLKIKYVSRMARAQQMVGIEAIDRQVGFIERLAALDPVKAIAKLNTFEAIDEHAKLIAVVPTMVNDSEDAAQAVNEQTQKIEQQAQMDQAGQMAEGAEKLSNASTEDNSLLTDIMEQQAGNQF
jgi:hypothetical protein